jgi:uncharacterized protein (TIGR02118 family)
MFKSVWGARFQEGISREEARAYWTNGHGPLGAKVPWSTAYVQNHMVGSVGPRGIVESDLILDGFACEWWADRAAFDLGMRSPEWQALVDDDVNVFAAGSGDGLCASVEERVLSGGERGAFKVVWFLRFRPSLDREKADHHWRRRHGPLVLDVPGVGRYQQNLVLASLGPYGIEGEPVVYDGLSEWWFADRDSYVRSMQTPEWERVLEDATSFIDLDALIRMSGIVEERVIKS